MPRPLNTRTTLFVLRSSQRYIHFTMSTVDSSSSSSSSSSPFSFFSFFFFFFLLFSRAKIGAAATKHSDHSLLATIVPKVSLFHRRSIFRRRFIYRFYSSKDVTLFFFFFFIITIFVFAASLLATIVPKMP